MVYTAGSDGSITVWNTKVSFFYQEKTKVKERQLNTTIVLADVNLSGNTMVYVTGYDWNMGIWGLEKAQKAQVFAYFLTGKEFQEGTSRYTPNVTNSCEYVSSYR